jgi:hypothetical protein
MINSATRSGPVTPSDDTELSFKRLYVGTTGDVTIQHEGADSVVTYANVPAGTTLDVTGNRVMAATTASDIVWMSY